MQKSSQKIKIYEKEIFSTMSFAEVLKICKTVEDAKVIQGEDVEKVFFTYIKVSKNKEPGKSYEIIFNDGRIESIEHWDVKIVYSKVAYEKIRVIQT